LKDVHANTRVSVIAVHGGHVEPCVQLLNVAALQCKF